MRKANLALSKCWSAVTPLPWKEYHVLDLSNVESGFLLFDALLAFDGIEEVFVAEAGTVDERRVAAAGNVALLLL